MLDKSLPYIDILMHRPPGRAIPAYALPPGYAFRLFTPGDERHWAEIEASVLEFPAAVDALLFYQKAFLPFGVELERRCLFVENVRGEKIATATAWWHYSGVRRDPWLEWVAVRPEYQGKGLGRAVVSRALELMLAIEGDRDVYLHTQTWSHVAVRLYEKLGFHVTDVPGLMGYPNSRHREAAAVLAGLDRPGGQRTEA